MWNLHALPIADHGELLDLAFPEQEGKLDPADKAIVLQKYAQYQELMGRPATALHGDNIHEDLRMLVYNAYSLVQDGRRLAEFRSKLKLLAETCPYCGYGPIEDLDHLLQRAHFKLFSIYPLNLVPCCATCNRGKRKNPAAEANKHQIHVYLENVSAFDFLRAVVNIRVDTGGLEVLYFIEKSEGMSEEIYDRLVQHLIEFNLQSRYQKQINIYLGALQFSILMVYDGGGNAALRDFLFKNASATGKRFGINDWRTALMYGLAACEEFCDGGFKQALGIESA